MANPMRRRGSTEEADSGQRPGAYAEEYLTRKQVMEKKKSAAFFLQVAHRGECFADGEPGRHGVDVGGDGWHLYAGQGCGCRVLEIRFSAGCQRVVLTACTSFQLMVDGQL